MATFPSLDEFLSSVNFNAVGDFQSYGSANQGWAAMTAMYDQSRSYFYGDIFDRKSDPNDNESPLLYPLRINLVKTMCLTQAAALWGQWEDSLLDLSVEPLAENNEAKKRAEVAKKFVLDTWAHSDMETALYEGGIQLQVYGGFYLMNKVDPSSPTGLRIDKLEPYNVFPIWHPTQPNRILEAYIVIPVDRKEAELAYGLKITDKHDPVVYQEHWTEDTYETSIGGHVLAKYSGKHTWGFVPIEYVPRMRAEGFYGLPLTIDLMGLQDELNSRLADIGDNINNAAHPIRWVVDYRGDPSRDFKMGADAVWDLGQTVGSGNTPKVGVLEAQSEPPSSFNFIQFMMDMTRYSSFTSPVAFGEDEGSQRSGVTLELRLWPMLQQAKASRVYLRTALVSLHKKLFAMATARDTAGALPESLAKHMVEPNFAQLVPRDQQMSVEEVVQRAAQDLISPEEAVAILGVRRGTEAEEVERIKQWMAFQSKLQSQVVASKQPEPGDDRETKKEDDKDGNPGADR